MKDHVYGAMESMMQCPTEEEFDSKYKEPLWECSEHDNILTYISNGWAAKTCTWRQLWPKFGRLFPHGHVETTNLVERLWQYIKYILLDARINQSAFDLLHALIDDSITRTRMGGIAVEFFRKKHEIYNAPLFLYATVYLLPLPRFTFGVIVSLYCNMSKCVLFLYFLGFTF
ncbi:hypothetical protein GOP47_0022969 [Adiantum capillus-veneris]|uniref:Uncharacterized protein n=1 Tax=Adiantum capillus-veneris TaxID=13818 RepID=A0A9D4U796_ADICA|nr:hypothetical protein GOP47_0022969 [Adiantum capillus-veneris]